MVVDIRNIMALAILLCQAAILHAASAPSIVAPPTAQLVIGDTAAVLSIAADDDGGEANLKYLWDMVAGPAAIAGKSNGSNAAKSCLAYFTRAGVYTLRCTVVDADGMSTSATVELTVAQGPTDIVISPAMPNVLVNTARQFSAQALDQFAQPLSLQPAFTWTATGRVMSATGLLSAGSTVGSSTISAKSGITGTTTATTVTAAAPVVVSPVMAASNPVRAAAVALSMLASDDNGEAALKYAWAASEKPYGANVSFSPNNTNAAKSTAATFSQVGAYRLTGAAVDAQNQRCTSVIDLVVEAVPASIRIIPGTAAAALPGSIHFKAIASSQFNFPIRHFAWSVTGGGTIDADGFFIAGTAGGPFTVTASTGGVSATASLSVDGGQSAAIKQAIAHDRHQERLTPLLLSPAFDAAAFNADPAAYLALVEPGRIWQSAEPGASVPALSSPDSTRRTMVQGGTVALRARTAPNMPVTFASLDGGTFGNGLACISVRANGAGLAQAIYASPDRIGHMRVLAASPVATGQVTFRIAVQ
jgi:hypothetical protein